MMASRQAYSDSAYHGKRTGNNIDKPRGCVPSTKNGRRWLFWGVPIGLVLVAGVAVGVAVGVSKSNQTASTGSSSSGGTAGGNGNGTGSGNGTNVGGANVSSGWGVKGSGVNGSTVAMAAGGSFVYINEFGGSWNVDPSNPYNVSIAFLLHGGALPGGSLIARECADGRFLVRLKAGRLRYWKNGSGVKTQ